MEKRLYRSSTNKIIGGVCGGLGEYFEIDPVLIRILTVLLFLASGFGLLAYIIAWIIIPKEELTISSEEKMPPAKEINYSPWHKYLPGIILIAIGLILLIREHWFWFDWGDFWPAVIIVLGLFLIFHRKNKKEQINTGNSDIPHQHQQTDTNNGGSVI
ncbi:MAG: PspC domain-containing protein [FCB group bacterium]|nr:PspC domain-containing protein [FCB group bacterium]